LTREHQLPVDEAVRIAREVADALEYAHRHGIVHRDIKPENILLHGGHAQVADFGIALAASRSEGGTRMTETGMSLGTPHYMSPEQAMGEREITPKADIYALGCVLYEMLTAEPPFVGATAQAIIARVMTEEPRSLTLQRRTIPPHVEAAVRTALQKLPADRFASAAEFAAALGDRGYAPQTTQAVAVAGVLPASTRSRALVGALAVAVAMFAVLAAWGWLRPAPPQPVRRFSMGLPPDQAMRQGVLGVNLAFSPDGRRMVYVGPGEGGDQLWLRERDRLDATPLTGTVGAHSPYFSPDGERIAFSWTLDVQLKVVPVTGGPPITLASPGIGSGGGGAWGPDGWIYFDSPGGLSRIQADGGTPELLIPLDSIAGEVGHAWPEALPNGHGLVYRSRRNLNPADFDLVAFDFRTRERHILTKGLLARYVAPGYLVYLRADGAVLAAPFDQGRFALTGPAVPLFEGVMTKPFGSADFAISPGGTLAYVPGLASSGGGVAEIVTVTREGAVAPLDPPVTYNPSGQPALSLSPDGNRVAIDMIGQASPDIWVKQLPSGPVSRLTFDTRTALRPTWSPDGRSVVYLAALDSAPPSVWRKRADGSTAAEQVWRVPGRGIAEAAYSRDGQWLIYRVNVAAVNADVFAVRPGHDTVPTPLLTGPFNELGAALSPDGRWLAYTSNESGRPEIFVRPFPNTAAGRWQVSTTGGAAARWARSGRELFYEAPSGDMMVVSLVPGPTFAPAAPRRLFPLGVGLVSSNVVPLYDLMPGDQRFVMVRLAEVNQAPGAGQLVVVDNWFEELRQRMRGRR
jgi:serine/threonine-protein kinase